MKKLMAMTIVLTMTLISGTAMSGSDTGNLNVTATVINACRIISTENVDFGDYDPTDPADNTSGQGTGTLSCTQGTSYTTHLARSNTMTDGADTLSYELYSDSDRSAVYPNSSLGIPDTAADNTPVTKNIYGTIVAQQDAQPGTYTETITFTVEY